MRPLVGGDTLSSRSRKHSGGGSSAPAHAQPMTFLLCSETEMEQSLAASEGRQRESTYGVQSLEDALSSAFGDDNSVNNDPNAKSSPKKRSLSSQALEQSTIRHKGKDISEQSSRNASPAQQRAKVQNLPVASNPLTPLRLESPLPDLGDLGTPGSVSLKSFRLTDEEEGMDDVASQAIASTSEDEENHEEREALNNSTAPQLVMPSISMPKRRPFTERGKSMGKLKILVTGEPGIGKTSLIRSIVQLCDDIVHVDPLPPSSPIIQNPSKPRRRKPNDNSTIAITEIYGSTKAYPSWWSEIEDSRISSKRRKSFNDTVLERNLCFVDTPGRVKEGTSTDPVISYIEALLQRNSSILSMTESEVLSILSGHGGIHVDVVFYLFSHGKHHIKPKDLELIRQLSLLTNVIPLIGKADMLTLSEIRSFKASILRQFQTSSIRPFLFGETNDSTMEAFSKVLDTEPADPVDSYSPALPPFAISSTPASDNETMDASLLMSPDYIQPLVPSELKSLITQVFNPENMAWLRHSAAKKSLDWRSRNSGSRNSRILSGLGYHTYPGLVPSGTPVISGSMAFSIRSASSDGTPLTGSPALSTASLALSAPSPSQVLVPRPSSHASLFYPSHNQISDPLSNSLSLSDTIGPHSYTLARLRDHAQYEEHLAQVRLAKWASDLQRSLANERERYEQLHRQRRGQWLLERVNEAVQDGHIVASPPSHDIHAENDWGLTRRSEMGVDLRDQQAKKKERAEHWAKRGGVGVDPRDPLGLSEWEAAFERGLIVMQVLGGASVLGALAVAVTRALAYEDGIWTWFAGWD
ncbi:hypothetical protein M501DRAFT_943606 [Patellaria atrata CBS 101060]|uniref:Septin-type G domain-containing protein n=1 Tax=Patellaria atrata CBS 101060 TaxID=1346257 RepID=A0A9P4S1P7_9PEZI|nr:hypothetical protein M501DRAFT_943606 [Patellaria atrata CBS 101060]